MKHLLFLVQRIPFPPRKGDKVRSYHLLTYLREHYHVHLGTFVDDPDDRAYIDTVRALCAGAYIAPLNPRAARLKAMRGLLSGEPLTLPYFHNRRLGAWVERTLATYPIERVLGFSSSMAQYVPERRQASVRRVMDFVDVDSQKWAAYARQVRGALRWVYAREARRLLRYERRIAGEFDASIFVSPDEARCFRELCPEHASRIASVENGVDTKYFSPDRDYPNPYAPDEKALVFTGAMDYRANVDAVSWFARTVFPVVRAQEPGARFYVVGARPVPAVRSLEKMAAVRVTGAVDDVRPYLAHAVAAVAPLRVTRGIQNKVLEALAMAKPVLATAAALQGIDGCDLGEAVAEDPEVFAARALETVSRGPVRNERGRECVEKHYDWARKLERYRRFIEGVDGTEP